jgi:hypothetical protein
LPTEFSDFPGPIGTPLIQPDDRIVAHAAAAATPWLHVTVRFLADPGGTADADADGVLDPDDICPRRSSQSRDGCHHLPATLDLAHPGRRAFLGSLTADPACAQWEETVGGDPVRVRRTVRLYKARRGETQRLARTTIGPTGRFKFERRLRKGRYFASVDEVVRAGVVVCDAARSPSVKRSR